MDDLYHLAYETLKIEKQALIFLPTRASTEKTAETIAKNTSFSYPDFEQKVLKAASTPTKQCRRLAGCIKKGIAFHHAGLLQKQKQLIEDEFRNGKIKIICCTPTLCLSGDTLIWQPKGNTPVKNFKNFHLFALSQNNRLQVMKAKKVNKNKNYHKLIEITSVSGHSIKLTPNHKVLIKRNNSKKLIEAKNCNKKDKIATVGKLDFQNTKKPRIRDFIIENELPFKDRNISELEFYFIGSMLGDGHSGAEMKNGKIKYKGSPTFTSGDQESIGMIIDISKGLYSISTQRIRFGSISLVLSKTKWLREFLCRTGIDIGIKKHIHPYLMQSDLNLVKYLIQGLFDTDGCVENLRHLSFSNISLKLIKDLQKLLLRFGITSRLRKRPAGFMQILTKKYSTKESFELIISQNRSIFLFHKLIGFNLSRKQLKLEELIRKISTPIYSECKKCEFRIYKNIFSGRTREQKIWGDKKKMVIELLGREGELGSREIKEKLGFIPRHQKGNRLNHHYELISKRRTGNRSNTEWFWKLNEIGEWIYKNILSEGKRILEFPNQITCPLCEEKLNVVLRKKWRDDDFDGDIFWDYVRSVKEIEAEEDVYDVVLPDRPKNDHMFVANGFIIHNSAGLSLPAYRVIIKSLKRYTGNWGMDWIPVLEYLQMSGRAGRPEYEALGEAITVAKSSAEMEEIHDRYILGEPEAIYSKMAVEPVLRTYLLSLISSGIIRDRKTMLDFFNKTFWAHQFNDMEKLQEIMERMLGLLQEWEFIKTSEEAFVSAAQISSEQKFRSTVLGKRLSELYLDPLTGRHLVDCLQKYDEEKTTFSLLQMISHTLEMRPLLRIKAKEQEKIQEEFLTKSDELLQEEPSMYDLEYPTFMNSIKTGLFFEAWINERDEEYLLETFGIRPGEIRVKLQAAEWLLYAAGELTKILQLPIVNKEVRKLRLRIKHGAKEELLPLLQLRQVGRIRARKLVKNGLRSLQDLKRVESSILAQIVGKAVAQTIKKQLGQEIVEVPRGTRKGQLSMEKFN